MLYGSVFSHVPAAPTDKSIEIVHVEFNKDVKSDDEKGDSNEVEENDDEKGLSGGRKWYETLHANSQLATKVCDKDPGNVSLGFFPRVNKHAFCVPNGAGAVLPAPALRNTLGLRAHGRYLILLPVSSLL